MKKATAIVLLLIGAAASAYLLPAPGIVKRLCANRDHQDLRTLVVHGQYTFYGSAAKVAIDAFKAADTGGEASLLGEVDYKMPGRCALVVQSTSGVAAEAGTVSNVSGNLKQVGPELFPLKVQAALACPLLDQKSTVKGDADYVMSSFLTGLGIDFGTVSLTRFGRNSIGSVVYDIGARPRDLSRPQIWVGKETYEPARIIARYEGKLYDVRLIDYAWQAIGESHPHEIDVYEGETLLSRFMGDRAERNVKIPDAIF